LTIIVQPLTCGCQQYAAGPLRKRAVSVAGIAAKKAAPRRCEDAPTRPHCHRPPVQHTGCSASDCHCRPIVGLVQNGNTGMLPYLAGPIHLVFRESAYLGVRTAGPPLPLTGCAACWQTFKLLEVDWLYLRRSRSSQFDPGCVHAAGDIAEQAKAILQAEGLARCRSRILQQAAFPTRLRRTVAVQRFCNTLPVTPA
jgi:hypothetical protein